MKLNKLLLYTFICLIIWLIMSYSTLGNFEFFILFIIFASYLVFLVWQRNTIDTFANAPFSSKSANASASASASDSVGVDVTEEIQKLEKSVAKDIKLLKREDVVIEEEVKVVEEEVHSLFSSTMSIVTDLKKMPGEIKARFGAELDRLIYNVSPKKPNGEYINTVSIDDNYFKPPPKSTGGVATGSMFSKYPGNFSPEEIKKMKYEYMMVDMIFRELYHYNKISYNKLFYP